MGTAGLDNPAARGGMMHDPYPEGRSWSESLSQRCDDPGNNQGLGHNLEHHGKDRNVTARCSSYWVDEAHVPAAVGCPAAAMDRLRLLRVCTGQEGYVSKRRSQTVMNLGSEYRSPRLNRQIWSSYMA